MARTAAPAHDPDTLKDHIRDSANHIWLAGLGAFAKAQQEGGKVFESLIKDGLQLQRQTQQVAEEKIAQATHTMNTLASQFTERASGSWDRLETLFEQRVAKALQRLDWPSPQEVATLHARITALEEALAQRKPGKTSASAQSTAAKNTSVKTSTARQSNAKRVGPQTSTLIKTNPSAPKAPSAPRAARPRAGGTKR
ncbi:MAG: poly granule associated protein [Betaproteobacteria bacterium]|nr:poly granule associated protein [Betaproteobacteria bacterium]NBY05609.1 poly granule associated protein [Betaproteobacteria bacterium]